MARVYHTAHKRAKLRNIIRNLVNDLILYEHVKVVKSRKAAVQRLFAKVINLAKNGSLHDYRQVCKIVRKQVKDDQQRPILTKVKELASRYQSYDGGSYLQVHNLGVRRGDSASIYYLSLV